MPGFRSLLVALAVAAAFGAGTVPLTAAEPTNEPLSEVKAQIDADKAVLVDVRTKREWDSGHVEEALFLPLGEIEDGLSEEEAKKLPKDKVVYLHCAVGLRAQAAGELLEKQGYTVRPLDWNYKALVKGGFTLAKD